jgi:hypothetical protein
MSRPLNEYFKYVMESDVHDYGLGNVVDFLDIRADQVLPCDWVITNPPFNKADQFIKQADRIAKDGYAMLVRTSFLEGVKRYNQLFLFNPPDVVAQFSERVPMGRGRIDPKMSTATAYCWLVWYKESDKILFKPTSLQWIPPCRKTLERPGDYV